MQGGRPRRHLVGTSWAPHGHLSTPVSLPFAKAALLWRCRQALRPLRRLCPADAPHLQQLGPGGRHAALPPPRAAAAAGADLCGAGAGSGGRARLCAARGAAGSCRRKLRQLRWEAAGPMARRCQHPAAKPVLQYMSAVLSVAPPVLGVSADAAVRPCEAPAPSPSPHTRPCSSPASARTARRPCRAAGGPAARR